MKATIHLMPIHMMRDAIFLKQDRIAPMINAFDSGSYEQKKPIEVNVKNGEEAAEEMFDLTNHPGRQNEREEKYGRYRSLSVGDIVEVEGEGFWICLSIGWHKFK